MKREINFAALIACFNAIGFVLATAISTYVDSSLHTLTGYGRRAYPMGYWICTLGLPVLVLSFFSIAKCKSLLTRICGSSGTLLLIGFCALFNFLPEFPHGNVATWVFLFGITSGISIWIHSFHPAADYLEDVRIAKEARIERVKQCSSVWRAVGFGFLATYLGLLIPWITGNWSFARTLVTDPREIQILGAAWTIQVSVFSLFVFASVILEIVRKISEVDDLLLRIPARADDQARA